MAFSKNKYDTLLVWYYCEGKEELVPPHIRKLIPASTASTWRKTDFSTFIGHELRKIQKEAIEQYELFEKHRKLKKSLMVIAKAWLCISNIILPVLQKQKQYAESYIDAIQLLFVAFPKNLTFKIARLSTSAFHERLWKMKQQCGISPLAQCLKRHPLQLSIKEVKKIKELFEDAALACWPSSSLYYEGIRNRGLCISLSTFYKYVNLLGLKRKWLRKAYKTKGVQASHPNEYIHIDTTFWGLESGIKAAVVFVSDNYSRMILGWSVSLQHGAANVKTALLKAINTIRKYHSGHLCSTLVTDGGGENHAISIDELLKQNKIPAINKIIARKDISFSNSPVEAVNKIIKRYLRHYKPNDEDALLSVLELAVVDYTEKRPHGSLSGLIPIEAYTTPQKQLDFKAKKLKAKTLRIEQNRLANCQACTNA
jgi:transposase InsO family protein